MKRGKPLTRRTPLRSGKPLAPGAPPERKTALAPVNRARRKREHERAYGGSAYVEHLHAFPCAVCAVFGWTEAAHTQTGGKGRKADADTLVPLCGDRHGITGCHRLLDEYPWELPEGTEMRLRALAKQLWRDWNARKESESSNG